MRTLSDLEEIATICASGFSGKQANGVMHMILLHNFFRVET
jgi:hypothetical protein